ncbi:MAG: hypothetical protein QXE45_00270 [Thermoplasmata archaeon]
MDGRKGLRPVNIEFGAKAIFVSIAVVALCLGGMALRLIPLVQSPYPYILDGLGEARFAEDISKSGQLYPDMNASYAETHTISTPLFDTFLAMSSLVVSENPLYLIQKLIPVFSGLLLLGAFILSCRFTGSNRVGILALMALASYGPFVIITQASWKECIGLSLFPIVLISFHYRADSRMRILSSILILAMPFIHHFMALIVLLTISFAASTDFMIAVRKKNLTSINIIDLIIAIIAIDEALVYYSLVHFDRLEYLTPETGLYLFLGLAIVIAIGVYYISSRRITQTGSKIFLSIVSLLVALLFVMNIVSPIGTIEASAISMISISMAVCVVLMIIGIWGISIFSKTMEKSKTLFYAYISAPATLIIYAFLRAEDLISLDIITRTVDLVDIGIFIGVGIALVLIVKDSKRIRAPLIAIIASLALVSTIPIALDSERHLGTRNTVFAFEIDAIRWAVDNRGSFEIQTDVHFYYVRNLVDNIDDSTLVRRFVGTAGFEADKLMIASERWVSVGVKDLPYGWLKINSSVFNDRISECNLLYAAGPCCTGILLFVSPD